MRRTRSAFTTIELMIAIVIVGIMVTMASPRIGKINKKSDLRSARDYVASYVATARHVAIQRSTPARMARTGNQLWIETVAPGATTLVRDTIDLYALYGVNVTSTTTQIRFDPRGFSPNPSTSQRKFVLKLGADLRDSVCVTGLGVIMKKGCSL
jgi:prepilin-type N-terminal cleavage/methylation domain-containing protein